MADKPKVGGSLVIGAVAVGPGAGLIFLWLLELQFPDLVIPQPVAGAIGAMIGGLVGGLWGPLKRRYDKWARAV